jgi:two-component system CheB/CheR fusion protein
MLLNARRILQKVHQQQLIILTIQDITELREGERIIKEQEAWFRNMTNNVPVMIWTSGTDKLCNFVNSTWLRFTGRRLQDELGMGWTDSIHKDDVQECLRIYYKAFDKKKPFKTECRLRRHDGEYRWVVKQEEPNFSSEGVFMGYIASCIEVHDKKLAHEEMERTVEKRTRELKGAVEELNYTNTELSQFAYIASHDLQEPLRKIITYTDRLSERQEAWTRTEQEHLGKIISSAGRMRRLINDLLNFSKSSRPSKELVRADLTAIVGDVVKELDLAIEEKRAKISVRKLPLIQGVPLQFHQLFYNLIGNAIKFSADGRSPRITVSAKKVAKTRLEAFPSLDQNKVYHEIIVADNGIGFRKEFANQIFTIFQRLNTNEKYAGSGIGLALCRKIVTNHKGVIFAESALGEGARFHVILPES